MRLDVDALFSSASGVAEARALLRALPRRPRNAGDAALPRRAAAPGGPHGARALHAPRSCRSSWRSRRVAVDDGHMRSSTAAALVGAGALSTLAGPLHGLRMRRIAAEKRAESRAARARRRRRCRPRHEPGRRRPRAPGPRHLGPRAACSGCGSGSARRCGSRCSPRTSSRSRWRSACRSSTSTSATSKALPITTSAAQAIFGALAGGMITFTGIVFSAVFVAAQIQTSSYSPRLAARLRRDPVVIAGLALRPPPRPTRCSRSPRSAARPTRPATSSPPSRCSSDSSSPLVDPRRVRRPRPARVREHPDRRHPARAHAAGLRGDRRRPPARRADRGRAGAARRRRPREITHKGPPAVVAAIDRAALLRVAEQTGGFVDVVPVVGEYLAPGRVVLRISGARDDAEPRLVRRVFVLARQRTVDQDPAFVLRMLVDIAIRALSPAVNDPTTAVQVLDRVETLLVELAAPASRARRSSSTTTAGPRATSRPRAGPPTWSSASWRSAATAPTRRRSCGGCTALYDRLDEVASDGERGRVDLERRLLAEAVARHFPGRRGTADRRAPDRLGLGCEP